MPVSFCARTSPMRLRSPLLTAWTLAGLAAAALLPPAAAQAPEAFGSARVLAAPRSGDKLPAAAPGRTGAMLQRAVPTNQGYSALVFQERPDPVYAQPLSVRPVGGALAASLPLKQVVPTERKDAETGY